MLFIVIGLLLRGGKRKKYITCLYESDRVLYTNKIVGHLMGDFPEKLTADNKYIEI